MLSGGCYDLALIGVALPDIGGIELATFAANENVPAVLLSADAAMNIQLERWGVPCLPYPFDAEELYRASNQAVREAQINMIKVKVSAGRMLANVAALELDVAEAQQTIDEILAKLNSRWIA